MVANPVTLGDKLRNRRIELGLSQNQVAKNFNTNKDLIYMWEKNMVRPSIKRFPNVIQFLGYFPFDLNLDTLAGLVIKFRLENGLSQRAASIILGIDESSLCVYEKGVIPIKRKLCQIIKKLNLKLSTRNS